MFCVSYSQFEFKNGYKSFENLKITLPDKSIESKVGI